MKKNYIYYFCISVLTLSLGLMACSEDKDLGDPMIEKITITSIQIEPTDYNAADDKICMLQNKELQLHYVVKPENVSNPDVKWVSSDESIATVTNEGKVITKNKLGTAVVRVMPEIGFGPTTSTPTRIIEVLEAFTYMQSVQIANAPAEEIPVGDTYQLVATAQPQTATFIRYKWTSSNPEIATVDEKGVVTAHSKGKTTITATADDLNPNVPASTSVEIAVKVVVPITKVTFTEDAELQQLGYGQEYQVKYTLEPENATASLLTWTSDNPNVISVDKTGKLSVNTKMNGSAVITATYKEISKSVTVNVAEGRLCYSFANGIGAWGLEKNHNSSFLNADGEKSTIKLGGSPKGRGDFNLTMASTGQTVTVTPTDYRYIAVKIAVNSALVSGSNSVGCIKMEMFDNGSTTIGNNYVGSIGTPNNSFSLLDADQFSATVPNVIYYDLQGRFDKTTPGSAVSKINVNQFKFVIADYPIATAPSYDIYWVRSFKTIEELKAFVTSENNK